MIQGSEEQRAGMGSRINLLQRELPPLIRVPIPSSLRSAEWFRDAEIGNALKVYAFPAYKMGVFSGKIFPAWEAWWMDYVLGKFNDQPMVIGATSGNWGKDSALIAPIFPVRGFTAIVNRGMPEGKLRHLRASGAGIEFAPAGIPATEYAYELAQKPGYHLIDQYVHEGSVMGHERSMGHIARQMLEKEECGFIFGAVTGTCSTLMAADWFLRPSYTAGTVKIMGVASMSKQEKVPGARSPQDLAELQKIGGFPFRKDWKNVLTFPVVSNVSRHEAFALSADLVRRAFCPVGPTGALLMAGFFNLLRAHVEMGIIDDLRNKQGNIVAVLFWMDSYLAYIDDEDYLSFFES
jgi:cysteine synthase